MRVSKKGLWFARLETLCSSHEEVPSFGWFNVALIPFEDRESDAVLEFSNPPGDHHDQRLEFDLR